MSLRPYQAEAFEESIRFMRSSIDPLLIEAATGAGKSHIISAIAHWIKHRSNKKVLSLAPSKELTEQNHSKYSVIEPASFYSASVGQKSVRHDVVFGTPLTVKNNLSRFDDKFAAVIIDEAHKITPTIIEIIDSMKSRNKKLRVIGLTATPYRTNEGYIYQVDENGKTLTDNEAAKPYFHKLVYKITAPELIDMGFLTPPTTEIHEGYDTTKLVKDRTGNYTSESIELVFEGKGRKTSMIVQDVVTASIGRRGVLFFAASIPHAYEILESLPVDNARIIHGGMGKKEREKIIRDFKDQKFKYLINRDVLTVGFDAPHVDVIAILRKTESPGLLQQIIGRGTRLYEGKKDFLLLDYADNINTHFPDGDVFAPEIKVKSKKKDSVILDVVCPSCGYENEFSARPNPDGFAISSDGYFQDLSGVNLEIPSHFGRRCFGYRIGINHQFERCEHRWSSKECPECGGDNDIAARFCEHCKTEIIDPNEKLKLEYQKIKTRPDIVSTDKVLGWKVSEHISRNGNPTLKIDWTTEYRTFSVYYMRDRVKEWEMLSKAVFGGRVAPHIEMFLKHIKKGVMPQTITSFRAKGQPFFKVLAYNEKEDEVPQNEVS